MSGEWAEFCPDCMGPLADAETRDTPHGIVYLCECGTWTDEGDTVSELQTFSGVDFADLRDRLSALIDRGFDPCLLPAAADDLLNGGDGERNREAWEEIAAFLEEHDDESEEIAEGQRA